MLQIGGGLTLTRSGTLLALRCLNHVHVRGTGTELSVCGLKVNSTKGHWGIELN